MIKLTEEQQGIVDYLWEQVDNPEGHNTVISGKGGVGKTVLLCEMITQLLESGYKVAATAMTGKATAVLRSKVWDLIREKKLEFPKENLKIETVSKITKESKVLGMSENGETTYTNKWRNPKLFDYDVLFVDELSMVPQYVSQWWLMTNTRVFAFGDFCQLPEVSTADTKRELAGFQHDLKIPQTNYVSGYGIKVLKKMAHQHLETVLRSDNEIAFLCDDLRDFTKTKSDIVKTIKDWSEKSDNIQYSTSLEDLETDPSWQIIAYTNKMCSYINNQLCIGGDYPDLSDRIILFDNLNPLKLYNGDTLMFGEFLQAIAKYNNPKQKRRIYVCMKWDGKMPRKDSPNPIERNFFNIYVQFKQALDEVNSRRMYGLASIIEASGRPEGQVKEWLEDIEVMRKEEPHNGKCFQNIVEKFYEIDRDMGQYIADMSEPVPQLYVVNCGYGFAVTTHRCVSGDTIIDTDRGFKYIKDYNGEKVFNGKFYEQPSDFIANPPTENLKMVTGIGTSIEVTKNHTCILADGREIPASEVEVGDKINMPLNLRHQGESKDLTPYLLGRGDCREVRYNLPKKMDTKFALFLGLMVGDGTIFKNGIRLVKRHREVVETFRDLVADIFGKTAEIKEMNHTAAFECTIDSTFIARYLKQFEGLHPNNKFVPEVIMGGALEEQLAFLRGLFEDGTCSAKDDSVELSFKNPAFINQLGTLLINIGIQPSIRVGKDLSVVSIYGAQELRRFDENIGFISKFKQDQLTDYLTNHAVPSEQKEQILTTIVSIEEVESPTYCFTIDSNHRFSQNGLVWGNSQGSEFPNVCYLLEKFDKPLLYTGISRAKKKVKVINLTKER